ncbi:hypothetical protein GA0115242_104884 [Streptomyces sp. SolWspMP-5a-2]|nr:hypothetical protein GA0115242_104884 [Streptomyces sp. SolWspMP-5a-2]
MKQLATGPRAGTWVYAGRYIECCADAARRVMAQPRGRRARSEAWRDIGHPTPVGAYAHMREVLLDRVDLERQVLGWSGCEAPTPSGVCAEPTDKVAALPGLLFYRPLCGAHRSRQTVEAMWDGPGDWTGSW